MLKNYNPVIIFAFSKRECEGLALTMSKFEFNSTEEQELVTSIFTNAVENLSSDDRQLPQIANNPLASRLIAIFDEESVSLVAPFLLLAENFVVHLQWWRNGGLPGVCRGSERVQ